MTAVFVLSGMAGAMVPITVVVGVLEKHGIVQRRQRVLRPDPRRAIGATR